MVFCSKIWNLSGYEINIEYDRLLIVYNNLSRALHRIGKNFCFDYTFTNASALFCGTFRGVLQYVVSKMIYFG